jgi:anhydro-N-acetylmuramic acid kinase
MVVIGIISGSSLDGLDIAACEFSGDPSELHWSILQATTIPFDEELVSKLRQGTQLNSKGLFELDVTFAKFCAKSVLQFINNSGISADLICSHGHTIFHQPSDGYTVQIGNGGAIAALTGLPVVSDVRSNDVALGGQGAPIAPIVESYLLKGHHFYINFGGIANISIHDHSMVLAYDVCPCNQILNSEAQKLGLPYDPGGINASKGQVCNSLLKEWSNMDFFHLPAPKSLDNTWVMTEFYHKMNAHHLSPIDALATMTEFVAQQITLAIQPYKSEIRKSVFLSGGGAHNDFLISRIKELSKESNITIHKPIDDIIDFKEALLMALMGYLRMNLIPNTLSTVTGASRSTIGGALYYP